MAPDLYRYVDLANTLFPATPPRLPLEVCDECCCPREEQRQLVEIPRLEIPNALYYSYAWAAASSSEWAVAKEIRYFLPRIILATIRGDDPAMWESMLPGKLSFTCGIYSKAQLQCARDFTRDYIAHCCQHDTPLNPADAHFGEVIAGFAKAGLDNIDELLEVWRDHASEAVARAHFAEMTRGFSAVPTEEEWKDAFWLTSEPPAGLVEAFTTWYADAATIRAFAADA